ncbi:adenosine kinase [Roseivirga sp. BDSF3-8]|uniref:adenosine kinase n=1 Tax=Roseivirga sp. BDSF3-8 TaxID=3241598 RepID=UPI003531F1F4
MAKKYDVYGIGNALVDLEFEVTDNFFTENDIEKGMMTLVDEERQTSLMAAITGHQVKKQSGGSAANTIIAVNQFGGSSYYSCKVGNDELGKFYHKDLEDAGVDSNLHPDHLPEGITGKCLVMVTPDAERTMNTFLGITSDFSVKEIDENALKDSSYIYIEGYLIPSDNGREAMLRAKELANKHGVKTALTFSDPSMVKYFKDGLAQVVGEGVDLLFCNEEEARLYTGKEDILQAREELKKIAKTFCITQGSNGAMIFDGETFIDIEPYTVKAIDSNGAGDMFAGAFLYGITHGHSFAQAGKIASLASSRVVAKFGPRLEWHQAKEVMNHLFEN